MPDRRFSLAILCTSTALGGAELAALNLASWLRDRGHTCTLLGLRDSPFLRLGADRELAVRGIRGRSVFSVAAEVRRSIRNDRSVAVLTNGSGDLHAAAVARLAGTRFALLHFQHMQLGVSKRDLFHRLEQRVIDAWIAPLPWLARQVGERTTLDDRRIRVIAHGVDLARFRDRDLTRERARAELDLPPAVLLAGTVGRYDRGKGQEHLVRAVAILRREGVDLHALLLGEDTRDERQGYGRDLARLAVDEGVQDRVHFRPHRTDVETAYRALDIFALTSLSETYGLVTIEAMASGLAVVGTACGGTPEIVEDGLTGLLVPPADPVALAAALATFARDERLRQDCGRRASLAAERFSHHRQCEQVEELIAALTGV
jgi:D-inositol-3-phosphate glycosyltransferase